MTIATGRLTLEEFLKLPETKPASEYIEGEIIAILNHSQTPVGVVPPCLPRPPGQPSVGLPLPNLSAYFTTHLGLLYPKTAAENKAQPIAIQSLQRN
jgi:hypothetical protein